MAESEVQLNQEGIGPKVRTLALVEPSPVDASGNAQADDERHQQIVGLSDRRGDLLDDVGPAILMELRAIRESLVELNLRLA